MQDLIRRCRAIALCTSAVVILGAAAADTSPPPGSEQKKRVVIATKRLLDGRGKTLPETRVVIEGSKIVKLDPKAEPVDYDLRNFTVLPGWIDAHVHITWSFGPDGKNAGQGGTTQDAAYAAGSNPRLTFMAGV